MDSGRLFTMDTDYVCSSFYKVRHSLFGFNNHLRYFNISLENKLHLRYIHKYIEKLDEKYQMHVQWEVCDWPQCIHNKRSDRNIGYKTSIHYINVNPVTPCQLYSLNLYEHICTTSYKLMTKPICLKYQWR